jgi:hypothetical protein
MENAEKPSHSCLVSRNRKGKRLGNGNLGGFLDGKTRKIVAKDKI